MFFQRKYLDQKILNTFSNESNKKLFDYITLIEASSPERQKNIKNLIEVTLFSIFFFKTFFSLIYHKRNV